MYFYYLKKYFKDQSIQKIFNLSLKKASLILSTRVDLVLEEYMLKISWLQNSVPQFPTDEANEVMTRVWGAPTSIVCDDIASSPIAAAIQKIFLFTM